MKNWPYRVWGALVRGVISTTVGDCDSSRVVTNAEAAA